MTNIIELCPSEGFVNMAQATGEPQTFECPQVPQGESAEAVSLRLGLRQKNLASLASRGGIEPIRAIRLMAAMEAEPEAAHDFRETHRVKGL